jgi:undecaprenyl diphosphate synthase
LLLLIYKKFKVAKLNMKIPKHIGIILDGNRRWAKAKGLPTFEGHRQGFENLKKVTTYVFKKGIKIVTVYAFSTENWNRDKKEVNYLMNLFRILVNKEINILAKQGIKVNFFGRLADFDKDLQKSIAKAKEKTKNGKNGLLNICLSYGGRDELVRAFKKIVSQGISAKKINEKLISQNLDSAGIADPDMIIRTSGEKRLSGFLTWQSIYSELYFPEKTWPAFNEKDLDIAIEEYNKRQRRFGGN